MDIDKRVNVTKIQKISEAHQKLDAASPLLTPYFENHPIFERWNKKLTLTPTRWKVQRVFHKIKLDRELSIPHNIAIQVKTDLPFPCHIINATQTPLVLNLAGISVEGFLKEVHSYRQVIKSLIKQYGAILLRGLPIREARHFGEVVKNVLDSELSDYLGGDGSRKEIETNVFTSTEAPPQFKIPLHNERSAATMNPPRFICFFCQIAPKPGTGQTVLAKTKQVTDAILKDKKVEHMYAGKQALYRSCYAPKGHFITRLNKTHKTWQESFKTDSKEKVEEICKKKGVAFRWHGEW